MKDTLNKGLMLVCLTSFIFLASCNNDDDPNIVGTWTVSLIELAECHDPSLDASTPSPCDDDFCLQYIFTKDKQVTIRTRLAGRDNDFIGTYALNGNDLDMTFETATIQAEVKINNKVMRMLTVDALTGCEKTETMNK